MGRRGLTRKGNYILKSNLPIGVQNTTLKSIGKYVYDYFYIIVSNKYYRLNAGRILYVN